MPEPGCAPSQSRYAANTFGVYEVRNQCYATVDTNSSVCDLCRPRLWERACCCVGRLPPVALCSGVPWECRQSLRPRSRASTMRWSFSVSRGYVLAAWWVRMERFGLTKLHFQPPPASYARRAPMHDEHRHLSIRICHPCRCIVQEVIRHEFRHQLLGEGDGAAEGVPLAGLRRSLPGTERKLSPVETKVY